MTRLAIEAAPAPALPRLFLLSATAWGALAGLLLMFDGASALQSRWAPATLSLVHALTLGLLGNALFGSLLQFLPAAAGVRVRGGLRAGVSLHLLLNGGTLLLVLGLRHMHPTLLGTAAVALGAAFACLAAMAGPGLLRAAAPPLLRTGLQFALGAALVTAVLGLALVAGLTGHGGLALQPWVDVHAAWGVLGWVLGLLAAVATVVMPMFQGTRTLPPRPQALAQLVLAAPLLLGTPWIALRGEAGWLRWAAAASLLLVGAGGLWLQRQARYARNRWLVRSWRAGFVLLLGGALALLVQAPATPTGALVLGAALPWLVGSMQLEIVAFLAWIELHRHGGRGVRLPSVQALMPDARKRDWFVAQALAALLLASAAVSPTPTRAALAGGAFALSQALLGWHLHGAGRRAHGFRARATGRGTAADTHGA